MNNSAVCNGNVQIEFLISRLHQYKKSFHFAWNDFLLGGKSFGMTYRLKPNTAAPQ